MSFTKVLSVALAFSAVVFLREAAAATKIKASDEAAAISQIAMAKAKAGDFKLCAELYGQAYRTNPAFLGYLYSAARCAQKGGDLDAAERDYRSLLARAPADDDLAKRARVHIEAVLQARANAKPPPSPTPPVGAVAQPAPAAVARLPAAVSETNPDAWQRPTGWAAVVLGGTAAALGVWWIADGLRQRADLQERLDVRTDGLVIGMTPAEAHADEDAYGATLNRGIAFAAGGLLVGGLGTWLLATAPESVALRVLPAPDGFLLRLAWR